MGDNKVAEKKEEEAVFLPTTAQVDLERRVADAKLTPKERAELARDEGRDFTGDGNDTSAYAGVNQEYQNYANESDKPLRAGADSAVGEVEDELMAGGAVAPVVDGESKQTEGGGSSVPLMYATVSGSDFENKELTVKEVEEEGKRLQPADPTASTAPGGGTSGFKAEQPKKATASTPSK